MAGGLASALYRAAVSRSWQSVFESHLVDLVPVVAEQFERFVVVIEIESAAQIEILGRRRSLLVVAVVVLLAQRHVSGMGGGLRQADSACDGRRTKEAE